MLTTQPKVVLIIVPALLGITLVALAVKPRIMACFKTGGAAPKIADTLKVYPKKVYDKKLLNLLDNVLQSVNFKRDAYTLSGSISVTNKANSLENMNAVNFLISKKGGEFYYKEGNTETINEKGAFITIDGDTKRVIVAEQKEVNGMSIVDAATLRKVLESESYDMKSRLNGPTQTISLLNERHISCKEYSITFDTLTQKLSRIYTRITNIHEPLDKAMDKIIDIRINRSTDKADLSLYPDKEKVIRQSGNHLKLTAGYSAYQLIRM